MLAKYIRLSDQDDDCRPGEKSESNSVANQRALLDHFIASHPELSGRHVLEFIDDGHTGTNFNRPGVQALFSAVKRGEIDCIIVKDLSRFGRNSTEAGEYLERIFPLLQVRFIAVNDGYDSKTKQYGAAGDLDVGVRNIMNELYSRKVSKDVKTAKRQCAVRGECIAAYPFYGYVKGAENRRQLEIDPPAAETVRMIFRLWMEGNSTEEIANMLNVRQIPSPSAHKRLSGAKRTSWSKLREDIPWREAAVRIILRNERYTGKLISLRSARKEIGNPTTKAIPKEDWIVVEDAFEPIIDSDTFQKAQALFRALPPKAPHKKEGYTRPLFTRKIFCGVCGMGLCRQKAPRVYYRCKEKHGPLAERCKSVRIHEDDLTVCVLSELRNRAATFTSSTQPQSIGVEPKSIQTQIIMLEQKIEKQWSAKKDAFVKWTSGLISKPAYESVCAERQREIQWLRMEVERLNGVLTGGRQAGNAYPTQIAQAADAAELSRDLISNLIRAVRVFDDNRVEVEWKENT